MKTEIIVEPRTIDIEAGRRAFMRNVGLAAGFAALNATGLASSAAAATLTDADVLNFALNLEYLEAEFYLRAASGHGLESNEITGTGTAGSVSGGTKVPFATKSIRNYANEIASDERRHVLFLRSALGSARVARPRIDLNTSFTAAARAAGLISSTATFNAFANETNFLLAAFIFEDVGVTAYKGAARFIANKDFLEAAAGILAVEAYHAGTIRTVLYAKEIFVPVSKISDARDSLDGTSNLDQGIGNKDVSNIVPTDANGLAFSRTPSQVLKIAYLGGKTKGGFFPLGLNGTIKSA